MFRSNRLPLLAACATAALLALTPTSSLRAQAEPTDKLVLVPQHLLGLIHAPEVHRELRFTPEQVTKLETFFTKMDGLWFRARNLPTEKQYEAISKIETALRSWMQKNASVEQLARLQQLELQAQGIRMLLRPEVAEKIGMDAGQTAKLTKLAEDTAKATLVLQRATMANAATEKMTAAVAAAATAENEAIKSVMRPEQLRTLGTLIGEKFDTAALKRIYPMAPELVPAEHWINSNPLTMKELRGKVVLLHFYAFQCHNCHANFGHYAKWHEKYDDSEVVVIGIQTPETSREREPDAVIAAAEERGLEFPILIDLESENWKAWSNTMWPTVYVIDKKGYIRQWWQGELNWNGATGDATIEKVVDELLQEPA